MVVLIHVILPGFHKSRTHEGVLILQIIVESIRLYVGIAWTRNYANAENSQKQQTYKPLRQCTICFRKQNG